MKEEHKHLWESTVRNAVLKCMRCDKFLLSDSLDKDVLVTKEELEKYYDVKDWDEYEGIKYTNPLLVLAVIFIILFLIGLVAQ